jgi:hypothetical protein
VTRAEWHATVGGGGRRYVGRHRTRPLPEPRRVRASAALWAWVDRLLGVQR